MHRHSRYLVENGNPTEMKIRNPRSSQVVGRDELFGRSYEANGAPEIGWHACDRAYAAANKLSPWRCKSAGTAISRFSCNKGDASHEGDC